MVWHGVVVLVWHGMVWYGIPAPRPVECALCHTVPAGQAKMPAESPCNCELSSLAGASARSVAWGLC